METNATFQEFYTTARNNIAQNAFLHRVERALHHFARRPKDLPELQVMACIETCKLVKALKKQTFNEANLLLNQFVMETDGDVSASDIDRYLETLQTPTCIVRLLSHPVDRELPPNCVIKYGRHTRTNQLWLVCTPTLDYLVQDAHNMGCDYLDPEQRQQMQDSLDQCGYVIFTRPPDATAKRVLQDAVCRPGERVEFFNE